MFQCVKFKVAHIQLSSIYAGYKGLANWIKFSIKVIMINGQLSGSNFGLIFFLASVFDFIQ